MLALSEHFLLFVAFNEIQHMKQTIIFCIHEIQPMKQTGRPLLLNLVSPKKHSIPPFLLRNIPQEKTPLPSGLVIILILDQNHLNKFNRHLYILLI